MKPSNPSRFLPHPGLALLICGSVLMTGCGDKPPFTIEKVSGTVTYEDGSPIPGSSVQIVFVPLTPPIDPKVYPRKASGTVNLADGSFDCLTTNAYGDGATVGPQKVLVQSNNEQGQPSGAVPEEYYDIAKTPLTTDVTAGHGPYQFKVAKPAK